MQSNPALIRAAATIDLHRSEVVVALGNLRSAAVAERAGVIRDAVLRERVAIGTRMHDAALYVAFAP